jgi:UDP-glucose 4-epimerase
MSRILVTGGAGYVGSVCCRQLQARGHHVEVVDDLSTGHAEAVPKGIALHQASIGDETALSAIFAAGNFDTVFHFAAKALIQESVTNPAVFFRTNVAWGLTLVEVMRKYSVRNFVFSSTAAVYGTPKIVPIPEDHPKDPINSYGQSKLMFEDLLRWYASAYGWNVVVFRYFNACGGNVEWGERHEPETHIIPLLLQVASGRRPFFQIYGTDYPTPDGSCLRDFVHVLDIAEAHLLALKKKDQPGFQAYNIGTGRSHSVREICNAAEKVTGTSIPVREAARRQGDPAVLCASPTRLMQEFAWKPLHSELLSILEGAWKWEQRQSQELAAKVASS